MQIMESNEDWIYEHREGKVLIVSMADFGPETDEQKLAKAGPPMFTFRGTLADSSASVLFLRDRSRLWYHAGVAGFSTDLPTTAARVRQIAGNRPVLAMGQSMGGYGALMLGILGAATDVVAMSPQTFIDDEKRKKYRDPRWGWAVERIWKTTTTPQFLDLCDSFAGDVPRARFMTYFGTQHPVDKHHASNIERTPHSNTTPLDCGHLTGRHLRDSGELQRIVDAFSSQT
jgi:hypothetical protein